MFEIHYLKSDTTMQWNLLFFTSLFFSLLISYSLLPLLYLFNYFFSFLQTRLGFQNKLCRLHIQIRIRAIFRVKIFTRLPVSYSDSREYYGRETNKNRVYFLILVRNGRYVSIVTYFK